MMLRWSLAAVLAFGTGAALGAEPATDATLGAESVGAWGAAQHVAKIRRLYISGQPDAETLQTASRKGVAVVVNLRDPSEHDWDDAGAARAEGLHYYNVPVMSDAGSFGRSAIAEIGEILRSHPDDPILVYCASGNRASGWLAVHLVEDHEVAIDRALDIAEDALLTSPAVGQIVRRYLDEPH